MNHTNLGRSSERNQVDFFVDNERFASFGTTSKNEISDTTWQSRFGHQLSQSEGSKGSDLRWLSNKGIPKSHCWSNFPREEIEREIPWWNKSSDTYWLSGCFWFVISEKNRNYLIWWRTIKNRTKKSIRGIKNGQALKIDVWKNSFVII